MQRSETIGHLAEALAKVQGELVTVVKDKTAQIPTKTGRDYSYKYADLESVVAAARKPLSEAGLAVAQFPEWDDKGDGAILTTMVMHASGEWLAASIPLLVSSLTPQAQGSAITYARRYAYCAALGIVADEDDDGKTASETPAPAQIPRGGIPPAAEGPSRVEATPDGEIVEDFESRRQRILAEAKARGPLEEKAEAVRAAQHRTRPSPLRT